MVAGALVVLAVARPRSSRANGNAWRPAAACVAFKAEDERAKFRSGLLPAPNRSPSPPPDPLGRVMGALPARRVTWAELVWVPVEL